MPTTVNNLSTGRESQTEAETETDTATESEAKPLTRIECFDCRLLSVCRPSPALSSSPSASPCWPLVVGFGPVMAHVAYKWRLMSSCQIELSGQAGGPCPIPFEPLFCGTRTHTHTVTERRTDRMFVLRSNCSYSNWNSTILWLRFDLITTWQRVRAAATAAEAMGRGRCNCSSSMQRQPPPNIQYI